MKDLPLNVNSAVYHKVKKCSQLSNSPEKLALILCCLLVHKKKIFGKKRKQFPYENMAEYQ